MSHNTTETGSSSSTSDSTAALITNFALMNARIIGDSLDRFSDVLSSDKAGNPDFDQSIQDITKELDSLVLAREQGEEGIKALLKSVLDQEVVRHLKNEIERQVNQQIDEVLPQLVESFMEEFIPKSLQESVDRNLKELDDLHVQLHNTNARDQNASIRSMKHQDDPICNLLNKAGVGSEHSPASVRELLKLNNKELSELVKFYGMNPPGKKSENVNWFLQFSGTSLHYYAPG